MKEIIKKVFSFIKSLFNNDFKTNINNNKVNDIKKNEDFLKALIEFRNNL